MKKLRADNTGNACSHSVHNLLPSRLLSKNIKITIYGTIIFPVVLHECEICFLTMREKHRQRKMSIIEKSFKRINLYTILIQGISTIFMEQMLTYLFSKNYILCWHQNFHQFTTYLIILNNKKGKI